jgi:hypothetical protein
VSGANHDLQTCIIEAATAADVKSFMSHEFIHNTLSTRVQRRFSSGTERANVIDFLSASRSLEWVAVAVGCILDTALLTGDLGFDLEWQSGTVHGSGREVFPATSLERVGGVVKSVIQHRSTVKSQYIHTAGILT